MELVILLGVRFTETRVMLRNIIGWLPPGLNIYTYIMTIDDQIDVYLTSNLTFAFLPIL